MRIQQKPLIGVVLSVAASGVIRVGRNGPFRRTAGARAIVTDARTSPRHSSPTHVSERCRAIRMLKLVIARGVPAEVQMLSRTSRSPDNLSGQELAAVDDSTLEAAEFEADGMAGSAISSITPTTRTSGSVRGLNWFARSHDARWRPSDTADGVGSTRQRVDVSRRWHSYRARRVHPACLPSR